MPYIDSKQRDAFYEITDALHNLGVGDLNFVISTILDNYLKDKGVCYTNLNAAIGVLECAKLELYRRVAAPYEDSKLAANGEVYIESISSS